MLQPLTPTELNPGAWSQPCSIANMNRVYADYPYANFKGGGKRRLTKKRKRRGGSKKRKRSIKRLIKGGTLRKKNKKIKKNERRW